MPVGSMFFWRSAILGRGLLVALALALPLALVLQGCGRSQPASSPEAPVALPAVWSAGGLVADPQPWLAAFEDPVLEALVVEAWAHNPDLAVSAARVAEALAQADGAGAGRWPQVDAYLDAARSRRNVTPVGGGDPLATYSTTFEGGLRVSWELDVWGRLAAQAEASSATAMAAEADYQAARLSLAANVARRWYQAVHAHQQRGLAARVVRNREATATVFAQRLRDGVGSALDVASARTDVAVALADLADAERVLDGARRQLEVLLGRYPAAEIATAVPMPAVSEEIAAGLPADLLLRRPDLRAAAARLAAGDARLASAEANLLPRLSLTASGGTASDSLGDLMDPDYLVWNLLGNLLGPIFDGGVRRAEVRAQEAALVTASETFAAAVLVALREVEAALAADAWLRREAEARALAVDQAGLAEMAALSRYRDGVSAGSDLLRDQRVAIAQRRALLQVRLAVVLNRIDLYLALGGDAQAPERIEAHVDQETTP